MEWLKERGACNLDECAEFIGDGVEVTPKAILAAHRAGVLNPSWLARHVLTPQQWEKYKYKREPLWNEYEPKSLRLWAEYRPKLASISAEYHSDRVSLLAEYHSKRAPLWSEYKANLTGLLVEIVERSLSRDKRLLRKRH